MRDGRDADPVVRLRLHSELISYWPRRFHISALYRLSAKQLRNNRMAVITNRWRPAWRMRKKAKSLILAVGNCQVPRLRNSARACTSLGSAIKWFNHFLPR